MIVSEATTSRAPQREPQLAPQREESGGPPLDWRAPLAGIALLVLTLAVYVPVMRDGGFIWDDEAHVTQNPTLWTTQGLRAIWFDVGATHQYYPLVFSSFWVEWRLWHRDPRGYHLDNVLLQAANALLLWRLLVRLRVPGAWVAAAVFAVHPVHVETVAWISERKNLLSAFFALVTAHLYLRDALPESFDATRKRGTSRAYLLAFVCFVLAMFAKTVACTVPSAMLLLIWWKRGRIAARDWLRAAPFVVVGVMLGLTTAHLERWQIGAAGAAFDLSPADRLLVAGRAVWFYAAKLLWPRPLIFAYPRWHIDAQRAWQWLLPLSAVALIMAAWMLRRRAAGGRAVLVGVLYFAGTLLPALGFVNVYPMKFSFVADHFQYLASIGVIALIVGGAATLAGRSIARGGAVVVATVTLALLARVTFARQEMYRDEQTLWQRTLAQNPGAWHAASNLGGIYVAAGQLDRAQPLLERALSLAPENFGVLNLLGQIHATLGRSREAIDCFRRASKLAPNWAEPIARMGIEERKLGQKRAAEQHLRRGAAMTRDSAFPHLELASLLAEQGRNEEALRALRQAIQIEPDSARTHFNLAIALARLGKREEAIGELHKTLRCEPDHAGARQLLEQLGQPTPPAPSPSPRVQGEGMDQVAAAGDAS
jgi:Flp pilus assembly protein TadD